MTKQKDQPKTAPRPQLAPQVLFRFVALSPDYQTNLENAYTAPDNLPKYTELATFERIRKAELPLQVVAMTPQARGIGQLAWMARMNQFAFDAIPAIMRSLRSSQSKTDVRQMHYMVEQLIAALWRLGKAGMLALVECFNSLDEYCQGLACIAFGALRMQEATDLVWRYYQRVKDSADTGLMISALMGLVYLRHPQIDEVLAEVLSSPRNFVEQYPFAALAGGRACLRPLAFRLGASLGTPEYYEGERDDLFMALAAVAHRVGLEAYRAELSTYVESPATVDVLVDAAVQRPPEDVQRYFKVFFDDPQPKPPDVLTVGEPVTG
jgi:hypothetical protein